MSAFLNWAFSWVEVYGAPFSGVIDFFFQSRSLLGATYSLAGLLLGGGVLAYLVFRMTKFLLDVAPG